MFVSDPIEAEDLATALTAKQIHGRKLRLNPRKELSRLTETVIPYWQKEVRKLERQCSKYRGATRMCAAAQDARKKLEEARQILAKHENNKRELEQ